VRRRRKPHARAPRAWGARETEPECGRTARAGSVRGGAAERATPASLTLRSSSASSASPSHSVNLASAAASPPVPAGGPGLGPAVARGGSRRTRRPGCARRASRSSGTPTSSLDTPGTTRRAMVSEARAATVSAEASADRSGTITPRSEDSAGARR
jgi:hypothetical protein